MNEGREVEGYGYVRNFLKRRSERFEDYQRSLNEARAGTTYDIYLSRTVRYTSGAAVAGFVVGVAVVVTLLSLTGVTRPVAAGIGGVLTAVPPASVFLAHYYRPKFVAARRRRRIDSSLPAAVLYMHALSKGGIGTLEIIERLSDSEDAYDEAAAEFGMVWRSIDVMNDELLKALRDAKERTPSEKFSIFLDDMESVIESGGDMNEFLHHESERQIERYRDESESLVETLEVLAEMYIVLIFAAPILVIIVLIALSFTGAETVTEAAVVAYLLIPLGVLSSLVAVKILGERFKEHVGELEEGEDEPLPDDERTEEYERFRRRKRIISTVSSPVSTMEARPTASLVVTVPLAVLLVGVFVASGILTPTVEAYYDDPVHVTTWLVVVPFLVPSAGVMVFHERAMAREEDIKKRFPDMLEAVAGANENGVLIHDCFGMVSQRSGGELRYHLERLDNDVNWSNDLHGSLLASASSIDVPRISRAMKLLADGSRSTGNLSEVVEAVADDMEKRFRTELSRKRAMQTYVVVLFMGVLVYLFIAVMFDRFFFAEIAEVGQVGIGAGAETTDGDIPVDSFRTILYHSALLQAFGNSIVIGELVDNETASGLKYANVLIIIVAGVFAFA